VPSAEAGAACPPVDAHGWHARDLPRLTPAERRRLTALALHQYRSTRGPLSPAAGPLRALRETVRLGRRHARRTALLLMPEGSAFRDLLPPDARARLTALLRQLAAEEGAALVDARAWVEDEGFWDGHHLLPRGAAAFTRRLAREALPALLAAERF
jgi:hypothetical protein